MASLRPAGALFVLLVLAAGPAVAITPADHSAPAASPVGQSNATHPANNPAAPPEDPETDVLGWEGGYWYDEAIDVDQSDGLNESERAAFLSRTMARVEHLRGLEFRERPELEFVDREELRERREGEFGLQTDDQLWEAMLVFGEETNATEAVRRSFGGSVVGYAAEEGAEDIVIVNRDPTEPQVSAAVLAHELVHVLQHQQFDLSAPRYQRATFDGEFGKDGLVEGEASYLDQLYAERCDADWDCVPSPGLGWSGATIDGSWRFHRLTYQPYSDGAHYVARLRERGGWDAVDAAHRNPPASSAAVIHPGEADLPESMAVTDRSDGNWTRVGRLQTAGELGVYMLLWRQLNKEGQVDRDGPEVDGPYDSFDYNDAITAGWANDVLVPYADGDRRGYVWSLRWETPADAREFAEAYRRQLENESAVRTSDDTWVLEEGPFADAFRVVRTDRTVVVVNGPTEASLANIRATEQSETPAPTATAREGETDGPTVTRGTGATGTATGPTTATTPAVGVPGALVGLVVALVVVRHRRRRRAG
jgi:hypothetical protein